MPVYDFFLFFFIFYFLLVAFIRLFTVQRMAASSSGHDLSCAGPGVSKSMGYTLLLGYRASPAEAHNANLSEY